MNSFISHKNSITIALVCSLLILSAVKAQLEYDKIVHPAIVFTTETKFVMPAHIVKNFSFGFNAILADLYWVQAIQDFSIWNGTDTFYLEEYKNITTLDPKFSYPYLLGILTFVSKSTTGTTTNYALLETFEPVVQRGIQHLPENWEIPFYMGTGFQLTKNNEKALYYLKLAASHEKAPERIQTVYKSYLKNILLGKTAAGKDMSRDLVKAIYETTESKTTKKMLEESVRITDLTDILEGIVKEHKKKYGYYPSSIFELAAHNMLINEDLLSKQFTISINQNTGKVTVAVKK